MGKKITGGGGGIVKSFGGGVAGLTGVGGKFLGEQISDTAGIGPNGGPGPRLDMSRFDTTEQAQRYAALVAKQREDAAKRAETAGAANAALLADMQKRALGQAPTLSELQMRSANDRSLAQTMAAAAAARGGNPALAQRQIANQRAAASRDVAQQSAQARLQEQMMYQQAQAQEQAAADALLSGATRQGFDMETQPANLLAQYEGMRFAQDVARRNAVREQQQQLLGQGLNIGSSLLGAFAMSDKANKKNIKPGDKKISKFLDSLSAREYEYKNTEQPGTAPGKRVGIMAQDLEKSDAGKSMVVDTPSGKMVNYAQGFGTMLAAQAEMNKRLKKLEGK